MLLNLKILCRCRQTATMKMLETVACAVISDCNAEVCLRGLAFSVFRQCRCSEGKLRVCVRLQLHSPAIIAYVLKLY